MLIVQMYSLETGLSWNMEVAYDLGKIIKDYRSLAGWSALHVRLISCQILAGLNYLHSTNIDHRVRYI